jgi:hypothetical protein
MESEQDVHDDIEIVMMTCNHYTGVGLSGFVADDLLFTQHLFPDTGWKINRNYRLGDSYVIAQPLE